MGDARLAAVLDRIAVQELTARYNRCFDEADGSGWADTFTAQGRLRVADQGVTYEGSADLAAFCNGRGWGYLHLTTDHVVVVDGDVADQRCNLLMYRRFADRRPPELLTTGRYVDHAVRTPDGWRFAQRIVTLDADLGPTRAQEVAS